MAQSGTIVTAEGLKPQLAEMNRDYQGRYTWNQLYSAIDLSKQQQLGELSQYYGSALGKAYVSSQQQAAAISASNYGQGIKRDLLSENELALQEAFKTYESNYLSSAATIEEQAQKSYTSLNTALTEQAQQFTDYWNAHKDYLQALWTKEEEKGDLSLFRNRLWQDYTSAEYDEAGNEISRNLRTWEDLSQDFYEYDENGQLQLSRAGRDFYSRLESVGTQELTKEEREAGITGYYTWQQYLEEKNPKLLDWALSQSQYGAGETGAEQFRKYLGLSENQYSYQEYLGGQSYEKFKSQFEEYEKRINSIVEKSNKAAEKAEEMRKAPNAFLGGDTGINALGQVSKEIMAKQTEDAAKETVTELKEVTKDLFTMVDDLGLDSDLAQYGLDIESLQSFIENTDAETLSDTDLFAEAFAQAFPELTAMAVGGLSATGALGSAATLGSNLANTMTTIGARIGTTSAIGTAGSAIGTAASTISSVVPILNALVATATLTYGAYKVNESSTQLRKNNLKRQEEAINAYKNASSMLMAYANQKIKEQQIVEQAFNSKYGK